jgi:hypothetical protein
MHSVGDTLIIAGEESQSNTRLLTLAIFSQPLRKFDDRAKELDVVFFIFG